MMQHIQLLALFLQQEFTFTFRWAQAAVRSIPWPPQGDQREGNLALSE